MRDPVDEFQFKPLTEGLGFHKKNKMESNKAKPQAQLQLQKQTSVAQQALEMLEPPLPRADAISIEKQIKRSSVDEILKTLNERRKLTIKEEDKKPEPKWEASSWKLQAGLLDTMLLTAIVLAALIGFLLVSKVDLFINLVNPDQEGMVYTSLLSLFCSFTWIYLVASRIFMGCTAGEWISDQRMGRPEEFGKAVYQLKVVFRSLLVIGTGFIVFPILSLLFGKDILGKITGVELVKVP